MKHLIRSAPAAYAAGIGAALLLFFATSGRLGRAQADGDPLLASKPAVEPANDAVSGPPPTEGTKASQTPETVILKWPEGARAMARRMIEKYGEPARFTEGALVWIGNGFWEKTVVYRSAWPHFLGKRDKDYLEQTIAYQVPDEKLADLKRFDRRIGVSQNGDRLSTGCPPAPRARP
jgi:hypothetical protein